MAGFTKLAVIIVIIGVAVSKSIGTESLELQLLEKHQTVLLDLQSQFDIMMQRQRDMKELVSEVVRKNAKLQIQNEELEVRLQIIEKFLREFTLLTGKDENSFLNDVGNTEAELVENTLLKEDNIESCKDRLSAINRIFWGIDKGKGKQAAVDELMNLLESYENYFKRVCVPNGVEFPTENQGSSLRDFIGNREAEIIEYKRNSGDTIKNLNGDSSTDPDTPVPDEIYERTFLKLNEEVESLNKRLNELEKPNPNIQDHLHALKLKEKQGERTFDRVRRNANQGTTQSVFSVAMTNTLYGADYGQTVVFDNIFTNLGSNLIESNSTFIAPVAGYYYFAFTLRSLDNYYIGVNLMKNGVHTTAIYTDKSERNVMESQSLVLKLAAGDKVWLRLGPSNQFAIHSDDYKYCTFNGFILSEIST